MNGAIKEYATPIMLYDFEAVCGASSSIEQYPAEFEIPRENTGTLKNQGSIGACVACVISQVAEALYKLEFNEIEEMSEGYVYGALRDDTFTGKGMIVTQALEYWRKLGVVPKKHFDILDEMPEIKKIVKKFPELADIASKYKIGGYASLNYADREKRDSLIKKALFESPYPLVAVSADYFKERHCIEIVGWNDKTDKYKIKNSWGERYGDNGFAEIPKSEINEVYAIFPQEIELPFIDVDKEAWYYKYVKHAYFNGLMNGTSDNAFEPNRPMTRAEVAALMYNFVKMVDDRFKGFNKVLNEKLD